MSTSTQEPAKSTFADGRIDALPWDDLHAALDERGFAVTPPVLRARECAQLARVYERGDFRSRIDMRRHGFGSGEYKYFAYPLPEPVAALREAFYPHLATAANRWAALLGAPGDYPPGLDAFLERCHAAGQTRPTPLMLRYGAGDHNTLHQDLYGEIAFPFQVVTVLSPRTDYEGGELVLVEQRPRQQSRAHVVAPDQGQFLIFATRHRPAHGTRGHYRTTLRHGVSTVSRGRRTSLGLIFHDAR